MVLSDILLSDPTESQSLDTVVRYCILVVDCLHMTQHKPGRKGPR